MQRELTGLRYVPLYNIIIFIIDCMQGEALLVVTKVTWKLIASMYRNRKLKS